MTAAVKHMARKKPGTAGAAVPVQPRNGVRGASSH